VIVKYIANCGPADVLTNEAVSGRGTRYVYVTLAPWPVPSGSGCHTVMSLAVTPSGPISAA
jgi:hypothetical protein